MVKSYGKWLKVTVNGQKLRPMVKSYGQWQK